MLQLLQMTQICIVVYFGGYKYLLNLGQVFAEHAFIDQIPTLPFILNIMEEILTTHNFAIDTQSPGLYFAKYFMRE